ncbi:MAG: TetR/AcrR family transcriptional regulator [Cytophagaceae bacterium]|nr:TetR/AcrR family transcriptional regulator [Cytophagaceae bacterium]
MSTSIRIILNEKLYLRNPDETELGRRIIVQSISTIDELGFENFTFKKLAVAMESTEASIYRYFENKHKLLIYLISWYWVWLDYQIGFKTNNIKSAGERLRIVVKVLSEAQVNDPETSIDESALHRIVVVESSKAYLTKEVDAANQEGLYREYKKLCKKIAEIVLEINPTYKYSHTLVSTIIEASHDQVFFAFHLPSLTDIKIKNNDYSQLEEYLEHLIFSAIQTN